MSMNGVKSVVTQHLFTLAYLSANGIFPNDLESMKIKLFCLNNCLRDFMEVIMMEHAA